MKHLLPIVLAVSAQAASFDYPTTRKDDVTDDYHGTKVADPYRWLEDDNSAETKAWVEAQNKVTFGYLESLPFRKRIFTRLRELWTYERYGLPTKEGPWYVFSRISGQDDEKQPILYRAKSVNAP